MNSSDREYEIHKLPAIPKPSSPRSRRPLRSGNSFNDNFQTSHMEGKRSRQNISNQSEESSRNQSTNDTQMTESSSDEDEAQSSDRSRSYSGTFSSESSNYIRAKSEQDNKIKKNGSYSFFSIVDSYSFFIFSIVIISFMALLVSKSKNEIQTQSISESISDPKRLLSESIKSIKTMFRNQESDIWNDISSAINEVSSRTPKIPSIILLFSNETTIMDCLATKLAHVSSSILHADDYLKFNPKDFGNDAGEIITILNKHSPEKKKVVMIRNILDIDTEAIKALHNLCDRINPLVAEAVYILTMQTNNYESQQKKLKFVETQIYNKLSKSIDRDVLMALVTRITDGAIISVQPEPHLRYC